MDLPQIGFGTYRLLGDTCVKSVELAIKAGYRHLDTAQLYRNEAEVGIGIKNSGIARDQLFITTKVCFKMMEAGKSEMLQSVKESLNKLGVSYLDLLLLHAPLDNYVANWKDLIEIQAELGQETIRQIGVSNFGQEHLTQIIPFQAPYANQFEVSPFWQRDELIAFCCQNGIKPVAHSSLIKGELFSDPSLAQIAHALSISASKLLLSWAITKNLSILPRSANWEHMVENFTPIVLSSSTLDQLKSLDRKYATHPKYLFD